MAKQHAASRASGFLTAGVSYSCARPAPFLRMSNASYRDPAGDKAMTKLSEFRRDALRVAAVAAVALLVADIAPALSLVRLC